MIHIQEAEDLENLVSGELVSTKVFLRRGILGDHGAEDRSNRQDDQKGNGQPQGRK